MKDTIVVCPSVPFECWVSSTRCGRQAISKPIHSECLRRQSKKHLLHRVLGESHFASRCLHGIWTAAKSCGGFAVRAMDFSRDYLEDSLAVSFDFVLQS